MEHRVIKENLMTHLEVRRKESVSGMMWGGLLAVGGYIGAGVLLKLFLMFYLERTDGVLLDWFWLFFFVFFVLMMVAGYFYEPRERYDFGMVDNPFTKKDDAERADAAGGLFLVLPNFFYNYVKTLLSFFMNESERFDANLAVRLLAQATHPHYTVVLKDVYSSTLPRKTVNGTLITLEDAGVVSISRQSGTMTLTLKGRDIIGKDPVTQQGNMFIP